MWSAIRAISQGRTHLRYRSVLAATVLVASFAYILLTAPPSFAASTATRSGDTITYNGQAFTAPDASMPLPAGMTAANTYVSKNASGNAVSFLVFTSGPPASATDAQFVTYDFTAPSTYTNPQPDPREQVTITNNTPGGNPSCAGQIAKGVGWILCPVSNNLASFMDAIYKLLSGFLVVDTSQSTTDKPLYQMWVLVRDISNVAFVIAFIIVIYSQITSVGISKYGLKKAFPRLLVAAILVNISYWLCTLAIEISNYLGYSIYETLTGVYKNFSGFNNYQLSWSALTTVLLSGAGAGVGGIIISGGFEAAAFLLIPSLVGAAFALLVALIIMSARQALITILVIVSPLAFVAYVLPNTEKLFDKWKDTFMTMLLLFPIFSLLFSGAQLAGLAIIQTANGDAVRVVFGLVIQVAPIVITPLLIKFSGSLLGKVAGIVNNPTKGLVDRTRNWAQDRSKYAASLTKAGRGKGAIGRSVRYFDRQKRMREADMKDNEAFAQNDAERRRYQRMRNPRHNGRYINQQILMRTAADEAALEKSKVDTMYEETKAGQAPAGVSAAVGQHAAHTAEAISLEAMRKHQAETVYQLHLNEAMLKNRVMSDGRTIQQHAAGIGREDMVLATAIAKDRKDFGENAAAQLELMKHFKLDGEKIEQLTTGHDVQVSVTNADGSITTHTFDSTDDYTRDAAAEHLFTVGSHNQKKRLIESTGAEFDANDVLIPHSERENYKYRATVADAMIKSGFNKSAPAVNDKAISDVLNARFTEVDSWDYHSMREIAEGRLKVDDLAATNPDSLKKLFSANIYAQNHPEAFNKINENDPNGARNAFNQNYHYMRSQVLQILDNPNNRRVPSVDAIRAMNQFVGRAPNDEGH